MRKTGIDKIEVSGIKLELSSLPTTRKQPKVVAVAEDDAFNMGLPANMPIPPVEVIDTDELTPEQLLNWSSAPGGQSLGEGETL